MVDTTVLEKNFWLVLSNIILILIIWLSFIDAKRKPHVIKPKVKKNIGITCIFVFFLFAFWGSDWFHVAEFYPQLRAGQATHMENIYVWIAQNLATNYIVFRIIVWGACLLLIKLLFDRIEVQKDLLWLMFAIFGVVWCSYARVSLAMCLMYYGFAVLFKPYKHKYFSYIIAILAIGASYFCHKTALFGIILIMLATLVRKFNRNTIVIMLFSLPIIFILLKHFLSNYIFLDAIGENEMLDKTIVSAQGYLDSEKSIVGIGALLLKILERSAYILTGIISVFMVVKNKNIDRNPVINAFLRLDIFMVFISCLFLFNIGVNTSIIAERFFRFLFIPTGILIAYFWQIRYRMKLTRICYVLAILYSSYALLYSLYMFII